MDAAKVFISCGQSDASDERQIAAQISERLRKLGFDPYVAVQEQTLRGVKENIFAQLSSSEYFVFIDFARERLGSPETEEHRGSLFSHQELAIASYCDIPLLAFQEHGVRRLDGLLGFLQGNSISFGDRTMLPAVVEDAVRQHGWDPKWKNRLVVKRDPQQHLDVFHMGAYTDARYFQVEVYNQHRRTAARNCFAYLQSIRNTNTGEIIRPQTVELKWHAYTFPNVVIAPNSGRLFDAFFVFHQKYPKLQFSQFTDTNFVAPTVAPSGDFELKYAVLSDNFAPVSATFLLKLGIDLEELSFSQTR